MTPDILQKLARSRALKLAAAAAGSWRFWLGSALAAGTAGLVLFVTHFATSGDDRAYHKLGRERILLMNDDSNENCPVVYECLSYNEDASSRWLKTYEAYWVWTSESSVNLYHLDEHDGTELWSASNGKVIDRLWSLLHCRHGNTQSSVDAIKKVSNYLPHSTSSKAIDDEESAATDATAGQIVMQNTPDAQIVSSCLDGGVGTVYFDAVNGFTKYLKGRLVVEVATGVWQVENDGSIKEPRVLELDAEGNRVPPDDEHCDERIKLLQTATELVVKTNAFARCAWERVNLIGTLNADGTLTSFTNDVVELKVEAGDSKENFYRICAPVQDSAVNSNLAARCNLPTRFRIRRLDDPLVESGLGYMGLDGEGLGTSASDVLYISQNGLILVDNVIASYPAMKAWAVPGGDYVSGGSSRNVIGWTGVFHPEGHEGAYYPKIGETGLSVEAGFEFRTNAPPDPVAQVEWLSHTTAKMKSRVRYLGTTDPVWKDAADLAVGADGRLHSAGPVTLSALPGDFEYYFDTELRAPYYGYVDYSGSEKIAGTPGYSERISHVESRLDPAAIPAIAPGGLPSTGTDFFTRLREGRSDQLEYRLEIRPKGDDTAVTNSPFYLTGDRNWRTFVRVSTNATNVTAFRPGEYEFRIVGLDPAVAYVGDPVEIIPWSGRGLRLQDADHPEFDWTAITLDAVTDALMFQLVEGAEAGVLPSYTIVHGSYQDFNLWTTRGATATPPLYVGAFSETKGEMSGSSPDTREYPCELPLWSPPAADVRDYWTEDFYLSPTEKPEDGWDGHPAYEPFELCNTRKGWQARSSQWVCSKWHQSVEGGQMALQLGGRRAGSLEFTNTKRLPHGIDQVVCEARVAQAADFNRFAYYAGSTAIEDLKDYTFTMRAIMATTDASTAFDGNGSVSIVGYYQPREGCYEFRVERWSDTYVHLYLYKWSYDPELDEVTPELIGRYSSTTLPYASETYMRTSNAGNTSSLQSSGNYGELFMRCMADDKGNTVVECGVMNAGKKLSATDCSGQSHYCIRYTDSNSPFTFGSFGFGSLNCPAKITRPKFYEDGSATTFGSDLKTKCKDKDGKDVTNSAVCGSSKVSYYASSDPASDLFTSSTSAGKYKNWLYNTGMYTNATLATVYASVEAVAPVGELELYETHYDDETGKSVEKFVTNSFVKGFVFDTNCVFTVRNTEDSSLRVTTAKGSGDVVIDRISFDQWCATSYSAADAHEFDARKSLACPENYVYVNGTVVTNETERFIRLQPMRAQSAVVSVRAPLMDGQNDDRYGSAAMQRGIGLGMLSYTYRNADPHCVVIVQYRELSGSSNLKGPTDSAEGWIDVATNDFSAAGAKLAGDTVTVPVSQLGKAGVMRLVLAPRLVAESQDRSLNPTQDPLYGSIEITDFLCRDDPPVDGTCWWGWNLRTTSDPTERSIYDSLPAAVGMALALNNAVDADVDPATAELYPQHLPFVQTPNFATNVAGEISFRARKLPGAAANEWTEVAILGAKDGGAKDEDWTFLTNMVVKSDVYERYTYKTSATDGDFASFRLVVIGVNDLNPGVESYKDKMDVSMLGAARRVLIDEVEVTEAVRGQIRLFDVGAFRDPLDRHEYVENLFDIVQQPMCSESWSVQCEVKAVQLPEEVRLDDTTEVYLHWFTTNTSALAANWGWEKWQGKGKSARLARIREQPGFVFRGSYPEATAAVVEPYPTSGTVVQYMLEVRYKNADGTAAKPYFMPAADWTKPRWYNGVDYNSSYRQSGFAAYTILDSVAYGYAWINEVNIYDTDEKGATDTANVSNQYVEVAVPLGADITDWKLEFVTGGIGEGSSLYTNTVVVYTDRDRYPGVGVPGKKTKFATDGYMFITAGNTQTATGKLKAEERVDGAWQVRAGDSFGPQIVNRDSGVIDGGYPLGIRLVRPSGIIEHEIVVAGTNHYARWGQSYELRADPTNFVAKLKREFGGSWYWTGNDTGDNPAKGRSVTTYEGVATDGSVWAHWSKTPGEVNRDGTATQALPTEVPKPHATVLMLVAKLIGEHFDQTICDYRNETNDVIVYVPKGVGTNITYRVDDWYGVVKITEQEAGKPQTAYVPSDPVGGHVTFTAAKDMSNDVTVVAYSGLRRDLTETYGLGPDNPYTDAVMDWLKRGTWGASGTDGFKVPGGEIKPAKFEGISGTVVRDLELTEMYWLDMDPTRGGMVLRAGMVTPPEKVVVKAPHIGPGQEGETELDRTDIRLGVLMEISSETGEFETYAPYTLNGLAPRSTSAADAQNWDAATFKIEGYLANGRDDFKEPDRIWVPLRHFIFDANSFDLNHETVIQVRDPFLFEDWKPYEGSAVYFRWNLNDNRIGAMGVETLRPDSTFHDGE